LPLRPTCQWSRVGWARPFRVRSTHSIARSTSPPHPSTNPNPLAIPLSPPASPIYPCLLRPFPAIRWVAPDSPFDGNHGGPRRFDPRIPARSSSTLSALVFAGDSVVSTILGAMVVLERHGGASGDVWPPWRGLARPGAAVCSMCAAVVAMAVLTACLPGMCYSSSLSGLLFLPTYLSTPWHP
jgi:hypothetical protein